MRARTFALALTLSASLLACEDDIPPLLTVQPPPDPGCLLAEGPQRYEVYFVIDVSGSMRALNRELANQVRSFSRSFPDRDAQDNRILVDYYVIAFVNDVLWIPNNARRMTEPVAVQAAIEEAIERGSDNTLLTRDLKNAEPEENLLDALAEVIAHEPREDAEVLIIVGTDADFAEAPERLSGNIEVRSNFSSIKADLASLGVQIHAFIPKQLAGLSAQYRGEDPLTSLPGSGVYSLQDIGSSGDLVEQTLLEIAQNAACN